MSLRPDGTFFKVLCDGAECGVEHHTTETLPVLAFYDATLRHGWKPHSEIDYSLRGGKQGVFCPACQEEMTA